MLHASGLLYALTVLLGAAGTRTHQLLGVTNSVLCTLMLVRVLGALVAVMRDEQKALTPPCASGTSTAQAPSVLGCRSQ